MRKLIAALALAGVLFSASALAGVNVNTASAKQLSALSGIGSVKAQAIVDYRKKHGDFKSLQDLAQVKGIGDKTVAGLQDNATVGDAAPDSGEHAGGDTASSSHGSSGDAMAGGAN